MRDVVQESAACDCRAKTADILDHIRAALAMPLTPDVIEALGRARAHQAAEAARAALAGDTDTDTDSEGGAAD